MSFHNVPLNEARIRRAATKIGIVLHSIHEDLVYQCIGLYAVDPLAEVLQSMPLLVFEFDRLVDHLAHCYGCCADEPKNGKDRFWIRMAGRRDGG